jgi:hypothetical protein
LNHLELTSKPEAALATADLVVEAITENLPLKQVFVQWNQQLSKKLKDPLVLIHAKPFSTFRLNCIVCSSVAELEPGGPEPQGATSFLLLEPEPA